jgi:hypothetical protein
MGFEILGAEEQQNQQADSYPDRILASAHERSDGRHRPDARGGREAMDVVGLLDDRAATEKADSNQDVRHHPPCTSRVEDLKRNGAHDRRRQRDQGERTGAGISMCDLFAL